MPLSMRLIVITDLSAIEKSPAVEAGDHHLHLKVLMGGFHGGRDRKMTMEQAAEHLWERFIEPLQRR